MSALPIGAIKITLNLFLWWLLTANMYLFGCHTIKDYVKNLKLQCFLCRIGHSRVFLLYYATAQLRTYQNQFCDIALTVPYAG